MENQFSGTLNVVTHYMQLAFTHTLSNLFVLISLFLLLIATALVECSVAVGCDDLFAAHGWMQHRSEQSVEHNNFYHNSKQ